MSSAQARRVAALRPAFAGLRLLHSQFHLPNQWRRLAVLSGMRSGRQIAQTALPCADQAWDERAR